jgi:malate dehydrogenase (oxaloacetate-decarboxylating)
MKVSNISWQERYRAPFIYTLRCRISDKVGALASLMTAISKTNTHVGDIAVISVDETTKMRDIQVFCTGEKHLDEVVAAVKKVPGIDLVAVRDEVLNIHSRGVIETRSRVRIDSVTALRLVYTPGVASMCQRIVSKPSEARQVTGICDRVAIVTNGTAVLGLGDIGTLPSLPVMEGKAAIFAEFAGISAQPVLVDSKDVATIVETVARIAGSFSAIQLEDIAAPACFAVEEELQARLDIPVFHDDQHGTATVLLAALINALKLTGRKPADCSALILGAGAAGYAIALILKDFGLGDIVVYDSAGPIYRGRPAHMNKYKQKLADLTNKDNISGSLAESFKGKDIFIGVAQPNMVSPAMISSMAARPLVFPLSNPIGEISVDDALKAGAAVAADGRTINNALAYPGLFRGALDADAGDITFEMQLAAAHKLVELSPEGSLLPDMLDRSVHQQVAAAVAAAWKQAK